MADFAPTEIVALARIIDELDYYQLLHVEPSDNTADIKRAYYASSRAFHPDSSRHLAPDLQQAIRSISKRVTEAYSVLRDPRRRQVYDRRLRDGAGQRIQLAEAAAEIDREVKQRQGTTPQGRQYFNLCQQDLHRGDLAAAVRNLQTALTFEPENQGFRDQLEELRSKLR